MRHASIAVLLVAIAPLSMSADWTKSYFAATQPGTWAKHKSTSTIAPASFVTYTRLPDQNGQIVIDQFAESNIKDAPPSTMRYTLEAGFKADRELIDFLRGITAASAQVGAKDSPFTELPADTVNAIKNMPAYAATAKFMASERVDGKNCDRYTYSRNHNAQQAETGEIWLSTEVPFGLVKQTMTFKDASGAVMYTGLTVLVESGTRK